MWEAIAVTIIAAAILAVFGWVIGLFQIPKHTEEWKVTVNRAKKDYGVWRERSDREYAEQLRRIDEEHNARGIYHSGIRLDARARAEQQMQQQVEDRLTDLSRAIDDAFRKMRRVDRAWMALKSRGDYGHVKAVWIALTKPLGSMEDDVLDPVLRRAKELDS